MSSCSTLAFWSDDSEEDLIEPVSLESIKDEYSISVEWKKSFKGENSLGSFKPSFYSGSMLIADPEGNVHSANAVSGKINWQINLDRELSSGIASGFGKLKDIKEKKIKSNFKQTIKVKINREKQQACTVFGSCLITNVKNTESPQWLKDKLV